MAMRVAEYMHCKDQYQGHKWTAIYFTDYGLSDQLDEWAQSKHLEQRTLIRFATLGAIVTSRPHTSKKTPAVLERRSQP